MMPSRVEQRLRAHVEAILRASHVPAGQAEDLAEELYGHLAERWAALVRTGRHDSSAADEAIRDFGTPWRIGGDLTRTYHGRLWASTIGVLLPGSNLRGPQPRIAWWLGASLRFYGVITAIGTVAIAASISPVRAAVALFFGVLSTALLFLAAAALRKRQRWALDLAIVANVVGLVYGLSAMLTTPGLISLNVIFSGLLLALAATERQRLGLWVRRSRPIGNALSLAILATVLGGSMALAMARDLPDPTQAGRDDLHVILRIECSRERVAVSADVRWDQVSLLPGGLANLDQYGDLLLLENSSSDAWEQETWPELVDVEKGIVVAEPDEGYAPNQPKLETFDGPAIAAIQINWDALKPGRTYRATWELRRFDRPGKDASFAASVEYIHADRFRWEEVVDCQRGGHDAFVSDWP